jgi:hypothetical protein
LFVTPLLLRAGAGHEAGAATGFWHPLKIKPAITEQTEKQTNHAEVENDLIGPPYCSA